MENITLEQLEVLIQQRDLEVGKYASAFDATLTAEQKALRQEYRDVREAQLDELVKLRNERLLQQRIDKAKEEDPLVKEVIREVPGAAAATTTKTNQTPKLPTAVKPIGQRDHYILPLVIKAIAARCHVWLVGPAGSGKTTLAVSVAAKLNLPYTSLSVCSQTTKTDLLGYLDAQGVYRATSFRQAYEHGGVFCLDEVDNGNANVLAVLNSALSSPTSSFPDQTVARHKDFVVIACANTYGSGATSSYVGRTQIDAATLDRFFFVPMPYDDGLESHVAGDSASSPQWTAAEHQVPSKETWMAIVRKTRNAVDSLGIKAIVSPRATYIGLALIAQGVTLQHLEQGLLYKGLPLETVIKLRQS
jgi:MoxR-like ATPase